MPTVEVPAVPAPPTLEQARDYAAVAHEAVRYLSQSIDDHPEFLERISHVNESADPRRMLGETVVYTAVEVGKTEIEVVRAEIAEQLRSGE